MKEIRPTAITEFFRKSDYPVPSHFNQSMMFHCAKRINSYTLLYTVKALCCYHEMLRSFWDGKKLNIREKTSSNLAHLEEFDLRKSVNVENDILEKVQILQSTINLGKGPLVHVGHFHLPEYDAVFFAIHHLVVDGVSWRIIAEDLNNIYSQLLTGTIKIKLPKQLCSFSDYADAVNEYASSSELLGELSYWISVSDDIRKHSINQPEYSVENGLVHFSIDREITQRVLTNRKDKYGVQVNDLLITALARAWKKVIGQSKLSISMEGHGREPFGSHPLDLNRVVGWFTSMFPVIVDCDIDDVNEHVLHTATNMSSIPNKGFGYGILLNLTNKKELACSPQMVFNFLGSFEENSESDQIFTIDNTLPQGDTVNPKNVRGDEIPISLNCQTIDGCIVGALSYSKILNSNLANALIEEFSHELGML